MDSKPRETMLAEELGRAWALITKLEAVADAARAAVAADSADDAINALDGLADALDALDKEESDGNSTVP